MSAERELVQAALGRIIREPELRRRVAIEPDATLASLGLPEHERVGMLAAGVERLIAYHEMVHSRLQRTIAAFIGPAAELLGSARLRADVDAWVREVGSTSAYIRDVPAEFLSWARPRWDADAEQPPWLAELAAHHIEIRSIRHDPRPTGEPNDVNLELDRPIVCNGTTRVLRYRWAVHHSPTPPLQFGPSHAPEPIADGHAVIGYRHPKHQQPRFVDIKPRSAAMLERLLAGQSLRAALFGACEAMGEQLDDQILSVTAVTLADLVDRQVLLGGG